MSTPLFLISLIGAVAAVYLVLAAVTYIRMRGTRLVVCPATGRPAAVKVDAVQAALGAVVEKGNLQLCACSRWPGRTCTCNQACSGQISVAPKETLVFEVLKRWYAGKSCAICRKTIEPLHAVGPKPGLLNLSSPHHEVLTWEEIPAENLPEVFKTHLAVCAHCQIAEVFRQQFPELVVDRRSQDHGTTTIH